MFSGQGQTTLRNPVQTRLSIIFKDHHHFLWQKFRRFRENKVTPYKEPIEESSEPKTKTRTDKVSDEPRVSQEFLFPQSTLTLVTNEPEPMPETPAVTVSRQWSTRRILASDMEYHSTLVNVYYKKVIFKGFVATFLTIKKYWNVMGWVLLNTAITHP